MKSFRETDIKVRLRIDMKRALQRIADRRCERLSVIVREAVKFYLDTQNPQWNESPGKRKAA
jgi:predicted transcriptional regulator